MSNAVLVATNSANATEDMKFRLEYQVEGGGRGNFDWQPTFGQTNAQLLADLLSVIQAVILAEHGLTIGDTEVLIMGVPAVTSP